MVAPPKGGRCFDSVSPQEDIHRSSENNNKLLVDYKINVCHALEADIAHERVKLSCVNSTNVIEN